MQPASTSAITIPSSDHSLLLVKHAQEVAEVRKNLWAIKAVMVRYQNSNLTNFSGFEYYNADIKNGYGLLIKECTRALHAFAHADLESLIFHAQVAQRLALQLHKAANHFKMIIEKNARRSKM